MKTAAPAAISRPQPLIVKIGEKDYSLRLNVNAMCRLEEELSTPERPVTFLEIIGRVERNDITCVRGLVWAAFLEAHPELTVEQVGELVDQAGGIFAFSRTLKDMTADLYGKVTAKK